jgi:hypothetical protein
VPSRRATLVLATALALPACSAGGAPATSTPPASPGATPAHPGHSPAAEIGAEEVTLGSALAQMRGHLIVARELAAAGDEEGALAHAGHPASELLPAVASDLAEHGGDATALETALGATVAAVDQGGDATALDAALGAANEQIDAAERSLVGDRASDPAYVGSVIASLLGTAAHEYEEGVADGEVRLLIEYQDAYGFVQEARRLYGTIETAVEAASAEEAAEIDEALGTLEASLPSPTPPGSLAPVEDVEQAAALVGHELEETVGARPVAEVDPAAEVAAIEALLDEIVTTYAESDAPDAAAELAAEAYLEHYELIEPEVIALAPAVNQELEPLLGADLRRRISEGAAVAEIEAMVERAKELLGQALEALEGS